MWDFYYNFAIFGFESQTPTPKKYKLKVVDCIMTTEAIEQQFQLFVPFTKHQHSVDFSKNYTENEDGTLTIEGIASTVNKDLQGDIILPSAIRSMKNQLLTTTKNLHGDHRYGLDGIYGAIKEVLDTDDTSLKIRADLLKAKSPQIKDMLDVGVNLGLSIGGKITEYTILEDHGWEIKDLKLMEISLTGMPANWDTYGTIQESSEKSIVKAKCLAGACHVMRKEIIGEIMSNKNEPVKTKEETAEFTKDDAVDLFNELMASKEEVIVSEIASETVKQVSKEIPGLVKAEFEKLKDSSNSSNSSNEEEEEEEETEEKEKRLIDLINNAVKSSVDENISNLFKNLEQSRSPEFNVDQINEQNVTTKNNESGDEDKTLTSREIAEKMFNNQSQNDFIASLLQ